MRKEEKKRGWREKWGNGERNNLQQRRKECLKFKTENNAKAIENRVWTKDWQEKRRGAETGSRTGRFKADGWCRQELRKEVRQKAGKEKEKIFWKRKNRTARRAGRKTPESETKQKKIGNRQKLLKQNGQKDGRKKYIIIIRKERNRESGGHKFIWT